MKAHPFLLALAASCLFLLASVTTGCIAAADAGIRELQDHGDHARYPNKSYGEHYLDALFDDDDDC